MKLLITGSKGFIGKNMIQHFESLGHDIVKRDTPFDWGLDWDGIDYCIHLGAISSTTETNADLLYEKNYQFSVKLFERCAEHNIPVQYASSASVYGLGETSEDFKEGAKKSPMNGYAWSKYYLDRHVNTIMHKQQIQGFRYFNVYGNYENHKGNQASPVTKFKKQKTISLFEDSHLYYRDFICVDDICEIHERMMKQKKSGIYNIGTGRTVSFETIALAIADKYEKEVRYIKMPDNLKSQYQKYTCANTDKLLSTCGHYEFTRVEDYINNDL